MPTYVNHLLSNKQFGFLLKASTFTATAQFTDQILTAVDNGIVTYVVSIDLTKAFDTVNHSMLLSILNSLGVSDDSTAYQWFKSYLSNRCH